MRVGKAFGYGVAICSSWSRVLAINLDVTSEGEQQYSKELEGRELTLSQLQLRVPQALSHMG